MLAPVAPTTLPAVKINVEKSYKALRPLMLTPLIEPPLMSILIPKSCFVSRVLSLYFSQGQLTVPHFDKSNVCINLFTVGSGVGKSAPQSQTIESAVGTACAVCA
jgi:hypothetical protein